MSLQQLFPNCSFFLIKSGDFTETISRTLINQLQRLYDPKFSSNTTAIVTGVQIGTRSILPSRFTETYQKYLDFASKHHIPVISHHFFTEVKNNAHYLQHQSFQDILDQFPHHILISHDENDQYNGNQTNDNNYNNNINTHTNNNNNNNHLDVDAMLQRLLQRGQELREQSAESERQQQLEQSQFQTNLQNQFDSTNTSSMYSNLNSLHPSMNQDGTYPSSNNKESINPTSTMNYAHLFHSQPQLPPKLHNLFNFLTNRNQHIIPTLYWSYATKVHQLPAHLITTTNQNNNNTNIIKYHQEQDANVVKSYVCGPYIERFGYHSIVIDESVKVTDEDEDEDIDENQAVQNSNQFTPPIIYTYKYVPTPKTVTLSAGVSHNNKNSSSTPKPSSSNDNNFNNDQQHNNYNQSQYQNFIDGDDDDCLFISSSTNHSSSNNNNTSSSSNQPKKDKLIDKLQSNQETIIKSELNDQIQIKIEESILNENDLQQQQQQQSTSDQTSTSTDIHNGQRFTFYPAEILFNWLNCPVLSPFCTPLIAPPSSLYFAHVSQHYSHSKPKLSALLDAHNTNNFAALSGFNKSIKAPDCEYDVNTIPHYFPIGTRIRDVFSPAAFTLACKDKPATMKDKHGNNLTDEIDSQTGKSSTLHFGIGRKVEWSQITLLQQMDYLRQQNKLKMVMGTQQLHSHHQQQQQHYQIKQPVGLDDDFDLNLNPTSYPTISNEYRHNINNNNTNNLQRQLTTISESSNTNDNNGNNNHLHQQTLIQHQSIPHDPSSLSFGERKGSNGIYTVSSTPDMFTNNIDFNNLDHDQTLPQQLLSQHQNKLYRKQHDKNIFDATHYKQQQHTHFIDSKNHNSLALLSPDVSQLFKTTKTTTPTTQTQNHDHMNSIDLLDSSSSDSDLEIISTPTTTTTTTTRSFHKLNQHSIPYYNTNTQDQFHDLQLEILQHEQNASIKMIPPRDPFLDDSEDDFYSNNNNNNDEIEIDTANLKKYSQQHSHSSNHNTTTNSYTLFNNTMNDDSSHIDDFIPPLESMLDSSQHSSQRNNSQYYSKSTKPSSPVKLQQQSSPSKQLPTRMNQPTNISTTNNKVTPISNNCNTNIDINTRDRNRDYIVINSSNDTTPQSSMHSTIKQQHQPDQQHSTIGPQQQQQQQQSSNLSIKINHHSIYDISLHPAHEFWRFRLILPELPNYSREQQEIECQQQAQSAITKQEQQDNEYLYILEEEYDEVKDEPKNTSHHTDDENDYALFNNSDLYAEFKREKAQSTTNSRGINNNNNNIKSEPQNNIKEEVVDNIDSNNEIKYLTRYGNVISEKAKEIDEALAITYSKQNDNFNPLLTAELEILENIYKSRNQKNDEYRAMTFRKAVGIIRSLPYPIENEQQVHELTYTPINDSNRAKYQIGTNQYKNYTNYNNEKSNKYKKNNKFERVQGIESTLIDQQSDRHLSDHDNNNEIQGQFADNNIIAGHSEKRQQLRNHWRRKMATEFLGKRGIGSEITNVLIDILRNGRSQRVTALLENSRQRSISVLTLVHGIGPKLAYDLTYRDISHPIHLCIGCGMGFIRRNNDFINGKYVIEELEALSKSKYPTHNPHFTENGDVINDISSTAMVHKKRAGFDKRNIGPHSLHYDGVLFQAYDAHIIEKQEAIETIRQKNETDFEKQQREFEEQQRHEIYQRLVTGLLFDEKLLNMVVQFDERIHNIQRNNNHDNIDIGINNINNSNTTHNINHKIGPQYDDIDDIQMISNQSHSKQSPLMTFNSIDDFHAHFIGQNDSQSQTNIDQSTNTIPITNEKNTIIYFPKPFYSPLFLPKIDNAVLYEEYDEMIFQVASQYCNNYGYCHPIFLPWIKYVYSINTNGKPTIAVVNQISNEIINNQSLYQPNQLPSTSSSSSTSTAMMNRAQLKSTSKVNQQFSITTALTEILLRNNIEIYRGNLFQSQRTITRFPLGIQSTAIFEQLLLFGKYQIQYYLSKIDNDGLSLPFLTPKPLYPLQDLPPWCSITQLDNESEHLKFNHHIINPQISELVASNLQEQFDTSYPQFSNKYKSPHQQQLKVQKNNNNNNNNNDQQYASIHTTKIFHDPNISLSKQQAVGLLFNNDHQKRVQRSEVTATIAYIQSVVKVINPNVVVLCCGSYRRGKESSGDVDVFITSSNWIGEHESAIARSLFLRSLLIALQLFNSPTFLTLEQLAYLLLSTDVQCMSRFMVHLQRNKSTSWIIEQYEILLQEYLNNNNNPSIPQFTDDSIVDDLFDTTTTNSNNSNNNAIPPTLAQFILELFKPPDYQFHPNPTHYLHPSHHQQDNNNNPHSYPTKPCYPSTKDFTDNCINLQNLPPSVPFITGALRGYYPDPNFWCQGGDLLTHFNQSIEQSLNLSLYDNVIEGIDLGLCNAIKRSIFQELLTIPVNKSSKVMKNPNKFGIQKSQVQIDTTWMGFCRLPPWNPYSSNTNLRIDLKLFPVETIPFALLYFTGSDHFNRSMRYYANRNGWSLSEHSLRPVIRAYLKDKYDPDIIDGSYRKKVGVPSHKKQVKIKEGPNIFCQSEEDVFYALKLPYVFPWDRNTYKS